MTTVCTSVHGLRLTLYVSEINKCDVYLGKGDFIMFLVIGQPNGPLQKKKTIKTFVLWDAPQLIKLININHKKYLGSWKSSGQKMVINKIKNKSSTQAIKWDKMCIEDIHWNSTIIVPYWLKMLKFRGYQNIMIFFERDMCQVREVPVQVGSHEGVPPKSYQVGSWRGRPTWGHEPKVFLTLEEPVSMGTLTYMNHSLFMGTWEPLK